MIQVEHLSKRYKKKQAVDDLSFSVEPGKVTGFVGPNGAGKSTTMRMMLGLDNGGGQTTFDGKRLHLYNQPSKVVGTLLEAKAFHPTRSARNHLRVLAAAGGIEDSRVDEVLDEVGLKDVAKKAPGKFSLGMSQRLSMAAALLGKPKYLLLDEPANGLDPEGIAWLRKFLEFYADQGNGVFVSSHLLSEMSQMADNVIVIGQGKLIANSSIKELLAGNHRGSLFVRTPKQSALVKLLDKLGQAHRVTNNGLTVDGMDSDTFGKAAFEAKIPIYELTVHKATLEEAFFDLTAQTQEFHAKEMKS